MTAPDPLVPVDVELRDFEFMPIEVRRLLSSETWMGGTGDECKAAMSLWLESWHQVPAGSLPNNDRMLAQLAQSDRWKSVKPTAMNGWVLCSDGRLYHAVVCEKVLEAWLEKLAQRISAGEGNFKRWGVVFDRLAIEAKMEQARSMLAALNPASRALTKRRTAKRVQQKPDGNADENPGANPDGTSTGSPVGSPENIPMHSQETETVKGQVKRHRYDKTSSAFAPPDWVPGEAWQAWLDVRKKKRAPSTDYALQLAVNDLDRLRSEGEDPRAVLDQSCRRGWTGLFTTKGRVNGYEPAKENPRAAIANSLGLGTGQRTDQGVIDGQATRLD